MKKYDLQDLINQEAEAIANTPEGSEEHSSMVSDYCKLREVKLKEKTAEKDHIIKKNNFKAELIKIGVTAAVTVGVQLMWRSFDNKWNYALAKQEETGSLCLSVFREHRQKSAKRR